MRIGLVSPYSWTYPGGVNRHIEALAPRAARARPRRARVRAVGRGHPARRPAAPRRARRSRASARRGWWRSGGTVGWPSNGAVSNLALHPHGGVDAAARAARVRARRRARARARRADAGLGHADDLRRAAGRHVPHLLDAARCRTASRRARRRAAAAEPAAPCGSPSRRRRRGRAGASTAASTGSSPTASTLPPGGPPAPRARAPDEPLRLVVRRPGRRAQGPAGAAARVRGAARPRCPPTLTVVGATHDERRAAAVDDPAGVTRARPRSTTRASCAELRRAPTCSSRRRSAASRFGMVLTEAFAAGTPVVASDIAGYRDVVAPRRRRRCSCPRGDADARWPRRCATRRSTRARRARRAAPRPRRAPSATPGRTSPTRSSGAYEDAIAAPAPTGVARAAHRPAPGRRRPARPGPPAAAAGPGAARGARRRGARAPRRRRRAASRPRRGAALYGLHRVGPERVGARAGRLEPGLGARRAGADVRVDGRCAPSPGTRSCAARCPARASRLRDALQGTAIGVLMSATLPARLGEPARAR